MPRYIDADELVDEIEEEIEVGNEEIYEEDKLINKGLKIALKDIKKQPAVDAATIIQSGWISVKDKMPEDHVNVLLVWSNGKVASIMFGCHITIKNLGGDWHTACGVRPEEEITHWMPLPEPPKEVQNDESL